MDEEDEFQAKGTRTRRAEQAEQSQEGPGQSRERWRFRTATIPTTTARIQSEEARLRDCLYHVIVVGLHIIHHMVLAVSYVRLSISIRSFRTMESWLDRFVWNYKSSKQQQQHKTYQEQIATVTSFVPVSWPIHSMDHDPIRPFVLSQMISHLPLQLQQHILRPLQDGPSDASTLDEPINNLTYRLWSAESFRPDAQERGAKRTGEVGDGCQV